MIQASKLKHIIFVSFITIGVSFATQATANCRDIDAITATDKAALTYFIRAELFEKGKVLKRHLPSKRKETASYIKMGEDYYTFFGLVELDCSVQIIKRTHARR